MLQDQVGEDRQPLQVPGRTRSSVVEREIPVSACILKVIRSIRVGFTFCLFSSMHIIHYLSITSLYPMTPLSLFLSNQTFLAQRSR